MSCCPEILTSSDLPATGPVGYTDLTNVTLTDGVLTKTGGVPGVFDAYANTDTWVEGDGCAFWTWLIHTDPPVTAEGNALLYVCYAEDLSYSFGWFFTNATVDFRRSRYDNGVLDFPVYYQNFPLGFNRFGITYNNGTIKLYETDEFGVSDPSWIGPPSYTKTGLDTSVRYRVRVFLRETVDSQSSVMTWVLGATGDVCGTAAFSFPPFVWSATGTVSENVTPRVDTMRFDQGAGSSYYLAGPVIDSSNELRSKVMKSMRVTGRRTNVSMKAYGYDVDDEINVADIEAGTNASTRAQDVSDTTQVAQSERKQINVKNAVLSTIRVEGDDTGQTERDEIHEVIYEQADQGVRR